MKSFFAVAESNLSVAILAELAGAFWSGKKVQFMAVGMAALLSGIGHYFCLLPPFALFVLLGINFLCLSAALEKFENGLLLWMFWFPLVNINLNLGSIQLTFSYDKIALVLMVVAWAVNFCFGRNFIPPLEMPDKIFIFLLFVMGAGLLLSGTTEMRNLASWAEWFSFYWIFWLGSTIFEKDEDRDRLVAVLVLACIVATTIVCFQYLLYRASDGRYLMYAYYEWGLNERNLQMGGTFGHKNFYAAFQILMLPLVVGLAILRERRSELWLGFAIVQIVSLGAGLSLGGYLGLATAVHYLAARLLPREWRWRGLALMTFVMTGLIVFIFVYDNPRILGRKTIGSIMPRIYIHRLSVEAWANKPFLGHGPGAFPRVIGTQAHLLGQSKAEAYGLSKSYAASFGSGVPWSAHSIYLRLLVESGALGLGAVIAMGIVLFRRLSHQAKNTTSKDERILSICFAASLAGLAVQGLTEEVLSFSKLSIIIWITAGAFLKRKKTSVRLTRWPIRRFPFLNIPPGKRPRQ